MKYRQSRKLEKASFVLLTYQQATCFKVITPPWPFWPLWLFWQKFLGKKILTRANIVFKWAELANIGSENAPIWEESFAFYSWEKTMNSKESFFLTPPSNCCLSELSEKCLYYPFISWLKHNFLRNYSLEFPHGLKEKRLLLVMCHLTEKLSSSFLASESS